MKQFFKYVLATVTGMVITFFLVVLLFVVVIAGLVASASSEKEVTVKPNSVLHMKFTMPISERTPNNPFKNFNFSSFSDGKQIGLNHILENIQKAKTDDAIKGIYMDMSVVPAGIATVEEIRNALIDFKKSGKFIVSYSEVYSQGAYYLASVADKIYLNPQGNLDWKGLSARIMFFKGTLEKLDIDAQIFRHGKFKSAIEPFDLDKMSPANRMQTMTYVNAIWNHILMGVSKSRNVSTEELDQLAEHLSIRKPSDALNYKLVDGLKYKDEVIEELQNRLALKQKEKVQYVEFAEYINSDKKAKKLGKEKIAIIYAVGSIESGNGDDETIGSDYISKTIREARTDSSIKAIVLRINSPGGSAIASDVIWREVKLAQKVKPVIVSMGDVAASGGYYIACAADVIVAQPNTITGSIGVFGLLPNMQKFFKNKLGITIDTANTNKHADIGGTYRPVTAEEGVFIQQSVENIYDVFIEKVAEGRKKTKEQIDSIGQGRVWSGIDAKQIGLVDELGGINDAIKIAAKKAKLDKYKIIELPKQKDLLEELLKDFGQGVETKILKHELGANYDYYQHAKQIGTVQSIQARMPYELVIY